jgi:hypothetical protein
MLRLEFSSIISQFIQKQQRSVSAVSPSALSLFAHIGFASQTSTWRSLIRKAAHPLVKMGVIGTQYARNIIFDIQTDPGHINMLGHYSSHWQNW